MTKALHSFLVIAAFLLSALSGLAKQVVVLDPNDRYDLNLDISNYPYLLSPAKPLVWNTTDKQHLISNLWKNPGVEVLSEAAFANCRYNSGNADGVADGTKLDLKAAILMPKPAGGVYSSILLKLKSLSSEKATHSITKVEVKCYRKTSGDGSTVKTAYLSINGKDVDGTFGDSTNEWFSVDFEGEECNMSEIKITSTTDYYQVNVGQIRITFDENPSIENASSWFNPNLQYNVDNTYSLPIASIAGIYEPELTVCTILDRNSGEEVATIESHDFTDDGLVKAIIPEEGLYSACYYMSANGTRKDSYGYEPAVEDGVPFQIAPTIIDGVTAINWAPIKDSFVDVPATATSDDHERSWEDAILSGVNKGVTAYWKTELATDRAKSAPSAPSAAASVAEIPSDYTKYDAKGIRLTGGDTLHLILAKNGAVSDPITIKYALNNDPTSVTNLLDADNSIVKYYHLDGSPADIASVQAGTILVRVAADNKATLIMTRK